MWLKLLAALLLGGIGTFAFSPFDLWWLIFMSVGGLLYFATYKHKKTALLGTFIWSMGYFCSGINWVHVSMTQFGGVPLVVSYLAVLLLSAYLSLYPLLFSYLIQRFSLRSPWVWGAVFTFTEYLREVVFTGFPWLQFGYTLIDSPFRGIAPLLGVGGLTLFTVVISGYFMLIFCNIAKKTPHLTALFGKTAGLTLIAACSTFWQFVQPDTQATPKTISLIQGNIAQQMKWDPTYFDETLRTYERLILPHLGKSDVIILPESAIPAFEEKLTPLFQQLQQLGARTGSEMIIGTLYLNPQQQLFNSAVVLGSATSPYDLHTTPRYNKHHLVPFGEYVPLGNWLDWMREVFILPINLSQGDFIQPPLTAKQQRFNMAICYEIIFGSQVQQNQHASQADYLLTISNDAWFGSSIGPWQHFQMARMRALELGKPLIRATNTGITAFIDHHGNVIAQAPQFEPTVLTATLQPTQGETLYGAWGNGLLYLLSFIIVGIHFSRCLIKK